MCAETGTQKAGHIYFHYYGKIKAPIAGQRLYFIRQLLPLLFPLPLWEIQDSEEQPR